MDGKKAGRPVSEDFEWEVLNECVLYKIANAASDPSTIDKECLQEQWLVEVNVTYSYEVVRICAEKVRKYSYLKADGTGMEQKWKECPLTRDLQFSNKWVWNFLKRAQFRRRRITTQHDDRTPSVEDIRLRMSEIQAVIDEFKIPPQFVFNEDETGINWNPTILYQYVPLNCGRGESSPGDETGRFTAMLGCNGLGDMLPLFLILKVKCKDTFNLCTSRVLNKFCVPGGVCAGPEWVKRKYTVMHPNLNGKLVEWQRPYLLNTEDLTVITVQNQAWNDAMAYRMRVNIQLGPYRRSVAGNDPSIKLLLITDNYGAHKTHEVVQDFALAGWMNMFLPPYTTGKLQPMDVVLNVICKAALRRCRIMIILEDFWKYRALREKHRKAAILNSNSRYAQVVPRFKPSVPCITDGVKQMLVLMENKFKDGSVRKSLQECFVRVGLCKNAKNEWVVYEDNHKGSLSINAMISKVEPPCNIPLCFTPANSLVVIESRCEDPEQMALDVEQGSTAQISGPDFDEYNDIEGLNTDRYDNDYSIFQDSASTLTDASPALTEYVCVDCSQQVEVGFYSLEQVRCFKCLTYSNHTNILFNGLSLCCKCVAELVNND